MTAPFPKAGDTMQFSMFPHKKVSDAKPLTLDRQGFIDLFANHVVRDDKDGMMFAPATFKGKRRNEAFVAACGLCLDFDHGQPTVDQMLTAIPGTLAAYYSTHSHTPEAPRFRVVIPLSRPVDAAEHAQVVGGLKSILPPCLREALDPSCFDRARAHYLPSCPPEQEHHAFIGHQDGKPLDVVRFITLGRAAVESAAAKKVDCRPASIQEPATPAPTGFEFIDPATGEVYDLTVWAAQNPAFDIVAAVPPQYRRGSLKDGRQHVICPFESEHTDQATDLATFAANALPPQFMGWEIHCMHSHCAGRDRLQYLLAMLEKGWISADLLQTVAHAPSDMKRPPRVYFPVKDISVAPEWSTLLPEERRIAYDLMAMMWAEDGTIAADDWMIARRLGMPESEWLSHRGTLTRTGWLVEAEDRLTNSIVTREFDLAQVAYTRAIERARTGGKVTQEKARIKKAT